MNWPFYVQAATGCCGQDLRKNLHAAEKSPSGSEPAPQAASQIPAPPAMRECAQENEEEEVIISYCDFEAVISSL